VTVQEIVALLRRHLAALAIVIIFAAGAAYTLKRTPTTYQESATVVFTTLQSASNPNPYGSLGGTLTDAAGIMSLLVMNPQSRQQIRAAGATADYAVALVNLYNLQDPDYGDPYLTISAAGTDIGQVRHTFAVVSRLLDHELDMRQANAHVPPAARVVTRTLADTGPQPQPGSALRMYAGLLILAVVVALSLVVFLDRHAFRLRRTRPRKTQAA
jgi:hypothetical protein